MKSSKQRGLVGVVGLGIMGGAFAKHLRAARFKVVGYDVAAARRSALRKLGGIAADFIGGGGGNHANSDYVIAVVGCIRSGAVRQGRRCRRRAQGNDRYRGEHAAPGSQGRCAQAPGETGVILLDCPISGTGAQAAVKDIVIYASGDRRACARCKAVFAGFARNAYYCGAFGTGSKLKFIANLLVTIHNLSTAEAFVLAERAGVDTELMYRVIKDGAGTSRMFEVRGPLMVRRNYLPATMKIDVYQKDIAIIKAFAAKLACPTPLFSLSKRYYDKAYAGGYEKHDTAAVHAVLRNMARTRPTRG